MQNRRLAVILSHLYPDSCPKRCVGSRTVSPENCSLRIEDEIRKNIEIACKNNSDAANPLNSEEIPEKCVFCDIIHGRAPAIKLYEDEICICMLDINPLSRGHSLVIPKKHFSSLKATPPSVAAAMCSVIPMLSNAIMEATHCDSFNLLVNNGAAAGQVIFHTHFHIIPRQVHDKLWRTEGVRRGPCYLEQEASLLAESIRERLSKSAKLYQ